MTEIDVLVVTALREELEAARLVALKGVGSHPGVRVWEPRGRADAPYLHGDYLLADGSSLGIALARPTRMGGLATAPLAATLSERLHPRCIAMCGVCAGNPGDVTFGDVVVAEIVYAYEEGKRSQDRFSADHRQFRLKASWVRTAQDIVVEDLPSHGSLTGSEAEMWLLERLLEGGDPRSHPARRRYFPTDTSWGETLHTLLSQGLIERPNVEPVLSDEGRTHVSRMLYDRIEEPARLPFQVIVGPMASGSAVVKDGVTWSLLEGQGVRTVVAIEMEAAAIANVAEDRGVPHWIVVKGVMDYADPRKDDRHKAFAARSSAEVMFKLLTEQAILDEIRVRPPDAPAAVVPREGEAARGPTALVAELAGYEEWQIELSQSVARLVASSFPELDYIRRGIPPGKANADAKPDAIIVRKSRTFDQSDPWVAVQFVGQLSAAAVEQSADGFVMDAMSVVVVARDLSAISASVAVTSAHLITAPSPDDLDPDTSLNTVLGETLRACFRIDRHE